MTNDEKKGFWIMEYGDFSGYLRCSRCKGYALDTHPRCPLCGTKMIGETDDSP